MLENLVDFLLFDDLGALLRHTGIHQVGIAFALFQNIQSQSHGFIMGRIEHQSAAGVDGQFLQAFAVGLIQRTLDRKSVV